MDRSPDFVDVVNPDLFRRMQRINLSVLLNWYIEIAR